LKLLPDTHAALWLLGEDARLSRRADRLLTDPTNEVLLSSAVVLEIAIKRSLGKLEAPDDFVSLLLGSGATSLAVSIDHAEAVESLPWHHRDPFDRLLVAQAMVEGAVLVSTDERLRAYDVRVEW
jgi:PIN domain nuclease of toxin-antitoxin system